MMKPLLYLFQQDFLESSTRANLTEDLLRDWGDDPSNRKQPVTWIQRILVSACAESSGQLNTLERALARYPQLSALQVSIHWRRPPKTQGLTSAKVGGDEIVIFPKNSPDGSGRL